MIRVVIADDQAVVRSGLRLIVESQQDLEVVAEAGDGHAAVEAASALRPDVVLMDVRMPIVDGIEATRRLTDARVPTHVLVLTTYGLDEYVYEALKAGAAGFLLKTDSPDQLVEGIRIVAQGNALLAPEITRRLIDHFVATSPPPAPSPALEELTAREREVLTELARGLNNGEIARALYVSEGTVKTHVAHIFGKLNLRDRAQAVVFAYEHGLARPNKQNGSGAPGLLS